MENFSFVSDVMRVKLDEFCDREKISYNEFAKRYFNHSDGSQLSKFLHECKSNTKIFNIMCKLLDITPNEIFEYKEQYNIKTEIVNDLYELKKTICRITMEKYTLLGRISDLEKENIELQQKILLNSNAKTPEESYKASKEMVKKL